MTAITASMVKELRDRTGLAMMECKKALTEANGDIELRLITFVNLVKQKLLKKLVTLLLMARSRSLKKVTKHSFEVNCQTDFVAKDENFAGFSAKVAAALAAGETDAAKIAELNLKMAKLLKKLVLRLFKKLVKTSKFVVPNR
jgi:elongation factor Ts